MRRIVVFSGAGLSADSGIPTFRDSNGLWENHSVYDVAEHEAWFRDKGMVLRFYEQRFEGYRNCKPHAGHEALARLEQKFKVTHITQNIDDLLEQAGCTDVRHLHGSIRHKKCEFHKDITTLDGDMKFTCDFKTKIDDPVKLGDLCPKCNSQLRPDVVWFNEAVRNVDYYEISELSHEMKQNDGVFICIGTSLEVYPAATFVKMFDAPNKFLIDKNPKHVYGFKEFKGTASEQLPVLVESLMQ